MKVYVSLTTIPSRVSRILEANLQSLFTQDYPVERIVVTLPTVNFRGQPCDTVDVSFLDRYPKVICHRPNYDWGPVMKYVGCLEHIPDPEALVFICDDDQRYASNRISNLVNRWYELNDPNAILGYVGSGIQSWATSLYTVYGVRGVLVPKAAIVDLDAVLKRTELPRWCAMNDDVFACIFLRRAGYHIVDHSGQDDEFADAENPEVEDALHSSYRHHSVKVWDAVRSHWRFNQPFMGLVAGALALAAALVTAAVLLI
jgi:hypothetical protein